MERAPLRPVPSRAPSPADPAEAIRHVTGELSALDAPAAEALALITLAGRSRDEVAGQTGLSGEQLAEALARGRKALRRRLHPLPGSGWCERAERLISDRIDDALEHPGPARLDVHLANCSRCVEHERRLAQAEDALVAGFVESVTPPPESEPQAEVDVADEAPEEPASAPPAALRIVDTARLTASASSAESPPDETASAPEPLALGADAPTALPPPEEAPALLEPDEPAALPEAEDSPALPDAEEPAALPEADGSPALLEPDEQAALPEAEDSPALPDAEEPAALPEADGSPALSDAEEPPAIAAPDEPAPLPEAQNPAVVREAEEQPAIRKATEDAGPAEIVPMPAKSPAPKPAPAPASGPTVERGQRLPPSRPYAPAQAQAKPRQPSASPTPARSRLAATYAPVPPADASGRLVDDETWTAVGPLLVIFALAIVLLAFAVLAVGL